MTNLLTVVMGIVYLMLSGCANLNYRPPLEPSQITNLQKSYVYGRFSLEHDFMNKVRLALQIENLGNKEIQSIRLLDNNQVYAVEVDPGTYQIKGFVYALLGAVMEFETKKIPLPSMPPYLKEPITIAPGKAYYLGDYFGSSRRSSAVITPLWVSISFQGGILGINQDFLKTTGELKSNFPNLNNIEFVQAWDN